jgi:hypothetical protein
MCWAHGMVNGRVRRIYVFPGHTMIDTLTAQVHNLDSTITLERRLPNANVVTTSLTGTSSYGGGRRFESSITHHLQQGGVN